MHTEVTRNEFNYHLSGLPTPDEMLKSLHLSAAYNRKEKFGLIFTEARGGITIVGISSTC